MFAIIQARPFVGFLSILGGVTSTVLTLIHVLTPILGFAGALFGAVAGYFTLVIKYREYKHSKQNET